MVYLAGRVVKAMTHYAVMAAFLDNNNNNDDNNNSNTFYLYGAFTALKDA